MINEQCDLPSLSIFSDRQFLVVLFKMKEMLEILHHFVIAGGRLEISLKCWSLQRNVGDLATMILYNGSKHVIRNYGQIG